MPSGLRFVVKLGNKLYNLSPLQWDLLQKKSIRVTGEWSQDRSLRGLVKQKLFKSVANKGVRTDLGNEVFKAIEAKLRIKDSKA